MALVIFKTFFNQDIASSLTFTPGALGGRSGMGLSGTATSDSSIVSVLSSLSVSTLAEKGNTTTKKTNHVMSWCHDENVIQLVARAVQFWHSRSRTARSVG